MSTTGDKTQTNGANLQSAVATLSSSQSNIVIPAANGKIAFQSDCGGVFRIYAMNPDGSNQTRLTDFFSIDPAFSADGSKITFRGSRSGEGNAEIYVMNADGSNQTRLTTNAASDGGPSWQTLPPRITATNGKIVFQTGSVSDAEIFVINPDGTSRVNLTNNAIRDLAPAFSPDGSKIVYVREISEGNQDEISVMNSDGSNKTILTNNFIRYGHDSPRFSPDGGKIVFARGDQTKRDIYVMNVNGSNQIRLTNNDVQDIEPDFSPDGSKIVFVMATVKFM